MYALLIFKVPLIVTCKQLDRKIYKAYFIYIHMCDAAK